MRHNKRQIVPRTAEWLGQIRSGAVKEGKGIGYLRVSYCGEFTNEMNDTPYRKDGILINRKWKVYLWDRTIQGFRDREGVRVTIVCDEKRPRYRQAQIEDSKKGPEYKKGCCRRCGSNRHIAENCDESGSKAAPKCKNCDQLGHFSWHFVCPKRIAAKRLRDQRMPADTPPTGLKCPDRK